MDDLFGDDDNYEESAAAAKKAAEVAKESKKKVKKEVIAMSLIMLEVNLLDDTTNFDDLAKKIFSVASRIKVDWKQREQQQKLKSKEVFI